MISYIFILGNSSELCFAEIEAVFKVSGVLYHVSSKNFPVVIIESKQELPVQELISRLGGTIKIAKVLTSLSFIPPEPLSSIIEDNLQKSATFGLSVYNSGPVNLQKLASDIKQLISERLSHIRYIIPRQGTALSSVVVHKQNIREFILVFDKAYTKWFIGLTQAVTNADEWTKRDMGRPSIDAKSGMLPLKVARMMVNLGNIKNQIPNIKHERLILLDPFCGMGTILAEAMVLSWQVIGSDNSPEVIKKAQNNLQWLTTYDSSINISDSKLLVSDATHVSDRLNKKDFIDAIVTEPFMGAVFEMNKGRIFLKGKPVTTEAIKNQIKGLEKLYLGVLKDWYRILKPGGKVVIALPEIEWNGKAYFVKRAVDSCEKLGYTLVQGPFNYNRPQAVVKRKIYILKKI